MKTLSRLLVLSLFAFVVCACGNKGDLVLPAKPESEPAAAR